jgi:signal transduction histidine kinase
MNAKAQKSAPNEVYSLEQQLNTLKPGMKKFYVQRRLAFLYLNIDCKKSLNYSLAGLRDAQYLKNDTATCVFLDFAGEAYLFMADNKNAIEYFKKDYSLAERIHFKPQMALALCDMCGGYMNESDYATAQSCSFRAIAIYEELKNYHQIAVCYINVGVVYIDNNDYKKAIFYADKALQFAQNSNNYNVVPKAYEIKASAYSSLNNNEASKTFYQRALAIYRANKNYYGQATVLSLLIDNYPSDYKKQLELGAEAQKLWDKVAPENYYAINNLGNIGSTYGRIAMHGAAGEMRIKYFNEAKRYLTKAIKLAKKTNTKSVIIDFSDSLSVINAAMGDYRDAYTNLKTSSMLYDSVYSQENKNNIASLEGKHEIQLKDKQLLINKLEIADQHKKEWFLIGGLITLILVAGLIYYQNIQRKKNNIILISLNNELAEANKVKTSFFNILNHDLRSPVANFVHFLQLQQEPGLLNDNERIGFSKKATQLAENLLTNMEDLLLWSKGQMENFKPAIKRVAVDSLFEYIRNAASPPVNIKLEFDSPLGMELKTDEHYLKTIVFNLTNNAIKALGSQENGLIKWKAWTNGNLQYLSITDNGPGATKEAFKALYDSSAPIGIKNGLGLHIVRDMAKAIGANLNVESRPGDGAKITIELG